MTLGAILAGGTEVVFGNGRPPAGGSGPIERSQVARPVLPCVRCTHRVVCSIKPKLEAEAIEIKAPSAPDPNVRVTVSVSLTCAFFADDGSPVEAPRIVTDMRAAAARGGAASKAAQAGKSGGGPAKRVVSDETRARMRAAHQARLARRSAEATEG